MDQFILRRLKKNNLEPSPRATPRALIRRLYYDLHGLPPTPEAVKAFEKNPSDLTYRRLVDRLLSSPRYGERWGRHWLDLARFGESDGFERNNPRLNLWHFRDWVIRSLNRDMPYDQFVRMQLIGDLMTPGLDGASAVGFLVSGVHNTVVGSSKRMKLLARQDDLEAILGPVGQTVLGLTVSCARCHDHKFDPIRTREYYQMIAAIDGINHGERTVTGRDRSAELAVVVKKIQKLQSDLNRIDDSARKAILAKRKDKPKNVDRPRPFAGWEFEGNLRDSIGSRHLTAKNGAKIENGMLIVNGRGFAESVPLKQPLSEKTLEAWVILDDLNQRGGGVMSLETIGGATFDAIVYGERAPKRWMAGSNFFRRTKPFGGVEEKEAHQKPTHLAIVYSRDGTITCYRNGQRYGRAYRTGFVTYPANRTHVLFGMRHSPAGSNRMLRGKILRANLYDRPLTPDAVAASAGVESNYVSEKAIEAWLSTKARMTRRQIKAELQILEQSRQRVSTTARTKVYTVAARNPGTMRVHIRGSVTDYGETVSPGGVASVSGVKSDWSLTPNASDAARRRKLAEWITHENNPLFLRVIVNRVWHYHFGQGLVTTPNDLGFNGGRPSHPELLDWLASWFKKNGQSLKSLHRLIVTSSTYRQSSRLRVEARAKDASNRLLWRYSPRRVEAEVLRDSILQIAGNLSTVQGGPGFEDVLIRPNNGTVYYMPTDRAGYPFNRRTVYRFTPRGGRSAVLDTFDCPDPSTKTPRRTITTTPLQALSLLNNSFILRMSKLFAQRLESQQTVEEKVRRAWELALGRLPDREEEQLSLALVKKHGLATLCRALFNANELVVIE